MNIRATQVEVARALGITSREVRNLYEKGLPSKARGNVRVHDIPDCVQWYIRFKREEKQDDPAKTASAELSRRRQELELAEIEMRVEEQRANLVTTEYMEHQLSRAFELARAQIMNLPGRLGPLLIGCKTISEVQIRTQPLVDELLTSLSDAGESEELDVDDEEVDAVKA